MQAGDIDQRAGRLDAALKLDQHIGAAGHDPRLPSVLLEQLERLVERGWLEVGLPHHRLFLLAGWQRKAFTDTTYVVGVRGRCNRPRDLPFLAALGYIRGRDRPKRGDFGGTPRGYPVPPNLPANADCVTRVTERCTNS